MTRDERLLAKLERDAVRLKKARAIFHATERKQRKSETYARAQRRKYVGEMADKAGLLVFDDETLTRLFRWMATVLDRDDPVTHLHWLLSRVGIELDMPTSFPGDACAPTDSGTASLHLSATNA